jgi:large subunit ribosomal protein L6
MSTEEIHRETIALADDVSASVDDLVLTISGPNGTVDKQLWYPDITVEAADDVVTVTATSTRRKTMATVGTFTSHIENMLHGVTEGWRYEMEIYYAHFPMQVSVEGDTVVIGNFLGERADRRTTIHGDTTVTVDGDRVILEGPSKEDVGQTAGDIEQLTRVTNKDTRVFMDGVYILEKPSMGED